MTLYVLNLGRKTLFRNAAIDSNEEKWNQECKNWDNLTVVLTVDVAVWLVSGSGFSPPLLVNTIRLALGLLDAA
ncbi:hypothetical protein C7Y66_09855 [Chroococcidiopsis sp. CCALA 051]|uniref:hypothetical protein n=1 Tax=Chroococcidiopsis sp. CCALA 051 TaxID=869949 RepID=UPI000D0CBC92|nr:hypothetical protein [Chroococcidiopsis sp. CCALA 051]PSM49307.1 hypothetical protein C7Y66_09855 [Chroococcidiopsis sp. CCALA 051]